MRVGAMRANLGMLSVRKPLQFPLVLRMLVPRTRDSIAGFVAAAGAAAILVNALFMQSGPHPAPIFASKPPPLVAPSFGPVVAMLPDRSAHKVEVATPARPRAELVADLQRELSKRGFYEGAADGVYGPRTDSAVRDFEQAAGLRASVEPTEALLATITKSTTKAAPAPARRDPIADLLAPNKRLMAIQRALADFGYGPIQPTGQHDTQTRAAIERFERARKRPVTGQVTEQLARDLAAMTGRPLEW